MMSQLVSASYPPVLELRPSTTISGLAPESYTIIAVAGARIYHAQLATKAPEWCYSRMRGTLVFGKDCEPSEHSEYSPLGPIEAGHHWFRLLDPTSGKPIWMFKIPTGFVYEIDRPFFHAFQGKSRRFGFLFEDDDEASTLAKKVIAQTCPPRPPKNRSLSFAFRSKSPSDSGRPPIRPSMVSLPATNSFVHVAHVGLNKDGIIEATAGIDPSWRAILEGYGHHGFDETIKVPERKISFADGFWRREREGSHSRAASTTELEGYHGIVSQEKIRRRMPSPSFTIF